MLLFSFTTTALTMYLMHIQCFDTKVLNRLYLMNEVVTMLMLYHMTIFTDWVEDPKLRHFFGKSLILTSGSAVCVHIFLMSVYILIDCKKDCKRKCMQKSAKKEKKEIKEN